MQNTISRLQQQINSLKEYPKQEEKNELTKESFSTALVNPLAEKCDLPSLDIVYFLVDLYYEYFHPNHCFLLPKKAALRHFVYSEHEAALAHAMFSVACRYTHTDPARAERVKLQEFHKDPNYWADMFQKHRGSLFTTPLVKALLLVGMSYNCGSNPQKSKELAEEAYQLCLWNNFGKRFTRSAEISNMANKKLLQGFSPQQLLFRESLIRTVWEVWRFRVQVAIFSNDEDLIPPFNGDMCLPVSDALYENELKGWDYKRMFWSDLDAQLLSETEYLPPLPENREESIYSGACMSLSCVNLLALVFKHRHDTSGTIQNSLEARLRTLYAKLPPIHECTATTDRMYILAHEAIYCSTLILHEDRANAFMVFLKSDSKESSFASPDLAHRDANRSPRLLSNAGLENDQIELRNIAHLKQFLASTASTGANAEKCRSYLVSQWAAHAICRLLEDPNPTAPGSSMPNSVIPTKAHADALMHLSPVTGFLLQQAIPVIASELVLQNIAKNMSSIQAGQLLSERVDNILEYPSFDLTSGSIKSPSESPRSSPLSAGSSRSPYSSGDSSGAVPRYSAVDEITQKLKLMVTSEEVIGTIWEKIKGSNETSKWVVSRAKEYEGIENGKPY